MVAEICFALMKWRRCTITVDPKVFDQVKVGDRVDFTWSTEVTVAVQ
jgi:hypothetical protein